MPVSLAEKRSVVLLRRSLRDADRSLHSHEGTALPTEPLIRLASFASIFAAMALWEFLAPRASIRQSAGGSDGLAISASS